MGAKPRLMVFDCDETLLVSKGDITVKKATGETITMDSATFAHFKPVPGDILDFTAFNHIKKPRKIKKNFDTLRQAVERGDAVAILTARAKGAESAIKSFLKHEGVDLAKVEVAGLGSSDPYDKARWISRKVKEGGFDHVEFFDDSKANAAAVADYGKKYHSDITFKSTNVPHPKEQDFDGPPVDQDFDSSDPVAAVVEYSGDSGQQASSWWERQTETFQEKYCGEHPGSKYC